MAYPAVSPIQPIEELFKHLGSKFQLLHQLIMNGWWRISWHFQMYVAIECVEKEVGDRGRDDVLISLLDNRRRWFGNIANLPLVLVLETFYLVAQG